MKTNGAVLVVDDEEGIRALLKSELTSRGYQVVGAANGREALRKLADQSFQVALCDIRMPELDGMETLGRMHMQYPDLQVIMMTGYASVESAIAAMKKGAYDFIEKPFHLEQVASAVSRAITHSSASALICPLHADDEWQRFLLAVRRWKDLDEAHQALQRAQQILIQKEKMAALGQLAAGVAHELNNPMTGIMGFSQMLCGDASLSPQQHEDVQTIYSQSQRCKKIIDNLLQFSRHSEPRPQTLDLRSVIESAQELTRYENISPVTLECEVPPGLLVRADFAEVQHLFLNLLTNARQALQGRPDAKIRVTAQTRGGWISVKMSDNGPGIAPEHLAKIFEPFFTTKPTGQGTGLGLSLCQSIVKNCGGRLNVENRLGQGAVFTVKLPSAV